MIKFILIFISEWVLIYLAGSYIAFDWNPTHWAAYTSELGRFLSICALALTIGMAVGKGCGGRR
jgi:hypothetical protein